MIKLFKSIFGSPDIVKESIAIIRDAGDALVYTDEEKAADRLKRSEQVDRLLISWMDTTKGQNLARRLLAVMITGVWLFMYVASFVVDVISVWSDKPALWVATSDQIGSYATQMNGAMMLILAFYFAAPHMDKIVTGAMDKFSSTKNQSHP